jgi:ankyrin repeat protein
MQKNGKLHLQIDSTLIDSTETNLLIDNQNVLSINKITQNQEDLSHYNHKHQVTNFIREEIILQHRPPKNSISELIFYNRIEELKEKLSELDTDPNVTDSIGTTYSWTPLYWGVKLRRIECVELLLAFGVDINTVINDCDECCGTVLDLATLRDDLEIEELLRNYAEKEDVNLGQAFKAIRTKLRGKSPAFNFKYYGKPKKDSEVA